jgi:hypothetical protein
LFEFSAAGAVKGFVKPAKIYFALPLLLAAAVAFAEIKKAPAGKVVPVLPPIFTNSILPEKKEMPVVNLKRDDNGDHFSALPPGNYVTEPYACMVKVPGDTHDDIARHEVMAPTNAMPVIRPELRPRLPAAPEK